MLKSQALCLRWAAHSGAIRHDDKADKERMMEESPWREANFHFIRVNLCSEYTVYVCILYISLTCVEKTFSTSDVFSVIMTVQDKLHLLDALRALSQKPEPKLWNSHWDATEILLTWWIAAWRSESFHLISCTDELLHIEVTQYQEFSMVCNIALSTA